MVNKNEYDVVIVGAGPAGASAAYFNAKAGKKVLLLDKQTFPRDKVCGDGITGKALSLLHEMELDEEIKNIKEISSKGVKIYAPNKKELRICIESPNDPFSAFSIDRMIIDNVIFEKAKEEVIKNSGEVIHETVKKPIVEKQHNHRC